MCVTDENPMESSPGCKDMIKNVPYIKHKAKCLQTATITLEGSSGFFQILMVNRIAFRRITINEFDQQESRNVFSSWMKV